MAFFKRKNKEFLDLTERYKKNQEKVAEIQSESESSTSDNSGAFGFLGNMASASNSDKTSTDSYPTIGGDLDERRGKLSKRLLDMTEKIENLSNQIYHLQQRIEVLERKAGVGSY